MTNLEAVALAAILTLAREPAVDPVSERPRLETLAEDIAHAVAEREALAAWASFDPLPWTGDRAADATSLALVAIAWHESGFRADVADCRKTGDVGRSITAFQLMRGRAWGTFTRRQLCRSPRLAARQALAVFAAHGSRCATPRGWYFGYAGGDCGRPNKAGARQCAIWERLARDAGIDASCYRRAAR